MAKRSAPGPLEYLRRWPLQLPEGPHRMLVSGHWDGTSQLVAHNRELRATAGRLPYLNGFAAWP